MKRRLTYHERWRMYEAEKRKLLTGPALTPQEYEAAIKEIAARWRI